MRRNAFPVLLVGLAMLLGVPQAGAAPASRDSRIQAANELVAKSDRYMHHSRLRRGMIGYGLTVLEGTKIVRFEVEIVSVMRNFNPGRDVVLARFRKQELEHFGVISGMSGSPVFINDGGKDKMIGAVAYGWGYQKNQKTGPLGGIQPISQMLATSGWPLKPGDGKAKADAAGPKANPIDTIAIEQARLSAKWRREAFAPAKNRFDRFGWPDYLAKPAREADGSELALRPLATPLMIGGLGRKARAYLTESLAGMNFQAVPAGGLGKSQDEEVKGLKLAPGSALAIPLVTGDADMSGVGTVTEVVDGDVVGFGHPMFGAGKVNLPMATGYIHAVMPSIASSFKLGGAVKIVGTLHTDESAAVGGTVGKPVAMIPLAIEVNWDATGQKQVYRYNLVNDSMWTMMLVNTLTMQSILGTRDLPNEHSMEYSLAVDFDKLGVYKASNFSSGQGVWDLSSDLLRPISLLADTPFGKAPPKSITVKVRVRNGMRTGSLTRVTLDRNSYAPGDTVAATVELEQYSGSKCTKVIRLKLPADLPVGTHALRIGDYSATLSDLQRRKPRMFDPRSLPEIFTAVQAMAVPRVDHIYAVLALPGVGLNIESATLADVPPTVALALATARPADVSPVRTSVVAEAAAGLHVSGIAAVAVRVTESPSKP